MLEASHETKLCCGSKRVAFQTNGSTIFHTSGISSWTSFTCYASTPADVVLKTDLHNDHRLNVRGYVDHHSLYTEFRSGNSVQEQRAVSNMQHALLKLKEWMMMNKLQMNDSKRDLFSSSRLF